MGIRSAAMLTVLHLTGIRAGSLLSLDIADMSQTPDGMAHVLNFVGKGNKGNTAWIAKSCAPLAEWLALRGDAPGPLFCTLPGRIGGGKPYQSITTDTLGIILRDLAERANVPHVSPHQLRHTFATSANKAGKSIAFIQARLGHASPTTTSLYLNVGNAEGIEYAIQQGDTQ